MSEPLVSLVIATHNREHLLPDAVKSIQDQTYSNFEIIIVDDASQDNTPTVIAQLCDHDPRIRAFRSEKNVGPGAARNLGIAQANGEYIAIMDDDDLAEPHRFQAETDVFRDNPDTKLVFSSVCWVDNDLEPLNVFPGIVAEGLFPSESKDIFKLLYLEGNKIPNTTIMFRRGLTENLRYPENPWIGEDWFLCMQLAASGVKMQAISSPLVRQRRGRDHQGLMDNSNEVVFQAQHNVLRMIHEWLTKDGGHEVDTLHKPAMANQILRESRHFVGLKGLRMILEAFILWPGNPKVREQLRWYYQKLKSKVTN